MMTKHMVQRSLTFLALTSILACTGDPTGEFANGVDHLQANPSTFYVASGATTSIIVVARDGSDNPVEASFQIADVGPGLTVARDLTFEPIRNDKGEFVPNPRPTRVRYNVTATAAAALTSFTISAGGKQVEVTTVVTPLTAGTFNQTTAAAGDTVTITATDGLAFLPTATADHGMVLSVAGDGSTLEWLVEPGLDTTVNITGVVIAELPDAPLTSVTGNKITVTGSNYAGTDDPATAPLIPMPAVGETIVIWDQWVSTGGQIDAFYGINPPAGNYTITLDWDGGADMDLIRCVATSPNCAAGAGYIAGTSAHPETVTLDFGTSAANTGLQKLWVQFYSGSAPTYAKMTIKRNS